MRDRVSKGFRAALTVLAMFGLEWIKKLKSEIKKAGDIFLQSKALFLKIEITKVKYTWINPSCEEHVPSHSPIPS